jgi:hypothetical protein
VGNWGSDLFGKKDTEPRNLQEILDKFPPKLKQAMFAAASRTTIKRATWNGCALNAAGFEVGKANEVNCLENAAAAFDVPYELVQKFITEWDGMYGTDEECTQRLREMIEKAGLFRKPGTFNLRVFEATRREEFDHLFKNNMVPDESVAISILDGSLAGV